MSIEQTKLFKRRIETPNITSNTLYTKDIIGDDLSYIGHYSTFRDDLIIVEGGRCDAICLQFSKEHFITGRIGKLQFPYYGGKDKQAYLAVQVYYEGDDQTVTKTFQETVFSNQKCKEQKGDEGISEVFFDNLVLPKDYKFVRFIFSQNNTEAPNIYTGTNCEALRVRIVSDSSGYNWDYDDCKVFTGTNATQNWYGYVNIVRLFSVIDEINEHKNDTIVHVTEEEKTFWNSKIDQDTLDEKLKEIGNLFDDEAKETIRNTKTIFAKEGTGSAARLHAWDLKSAEYTNEFLTQVTIYRPTNVAYIDSSDILHNNPQWLSVECLDVDGNLLDTYFSIDKDSQKDGDDNTTTWNFDEIKIKEEYHKLRFRVCTQEGVLENQPQSMARAILCYTYTNIPDDIDWGVIEQNNNVQAGHTMYFQFKTVTKQSGMLDHVNNTTIHVTAEDKERWDNSTVELKAGSCIEIGENNTISVKTADTLSFDDTTVPTTKAMYLEMGYVLTDAQSYADEAVTGHRNQSGLHTSTLLQNKWNGHVDDTTIHLTSDEKTKLNEHVNDTDIHVTTEEKDTLARLAKEDLISEVENKIDLVRTTLDEHIGDFEEHVYKYGLESSANSSTLTSHIGDDTHVTTDEKSLLQTLAVPQTILFSTKTDEMTADEYANCVYFSISKKHFAKGKLQKIEIPYKSGGKTYSKVWLCLQFYNSATEVKTFEDCIFSKNYQNQTDAGGTLVFEFDNVQIPYDYSFVRIMLAQNSTSNSEEPPTTLPSGNLELRITPLKTDTLTFDLDECEVKGKNGTTYNWLVFMNAETKFSFLDEYSLLLQEVKELKNRIEQLESNS